MYVCYCNTVIVANFAHVTTLVSIVLSNMNLYPRITCEWSKIGIQGFPITSGRDPLKVINDYSRFEF